MIACKSFSPVIYFSECEAGKRVYEVPDISKEERPEYMREKRTDAKGRKERGKKGEESKGERNVVLMCTA